MIVTHSAKSETNNPPVDTDLETKSMNLFSDTANAIRELRRIWYDPVGTVSA